MISLDAPPAPERAAPHDHVAAPMDTHDHVAELQARLAERENATLHLRRSNDELSQVLLEEDDPEFLEAVGENRLIIARYENEIASIRLQLINLGVTPPAAAPVVGERPDPISATAVAADAAPAMPPPPPAATGAPEVTPEGGGAGVFL